MRFDAPIFRRLRFGCSILALLVLLGFLTRPIESPAWQRVQAGQPELNLGEVEDALGQGLVFGMLGGFRAIMADFLWIRANSVWVKKDRAQLDAMIRLVTTLDPRPEFFWLNAARMTAYDVPNWRIREEGGYDIVPESRQDVIDLEQAEQAFGLVREALEFHPDNPAFYLEMGQIYLNRLNDPTNAAIWFLKAWEKPGAPYFAARIYAELLRRQDRDSEAYTFLIDLYRELPDDEPFAQKEVVLERIRGLEQTLRVPVWERFRP